MTCCMDDMEEHAGHDTSEEANELNDEIINLQAEILTKQPQFKHSAIAPNDPTVVTHFAEGKSFQTDLKSLLLNML